MKNLATSLLVLLLSAPFLHASRMSEVYIPNGCVVKAVAYLVPYLEENKTENGQIVILDTGDGIGHAVAVVSKKNRILIYDHELGEIITNIETQAFNDNPSRLSIESAYKNARLIAKNSIKSGGRKARIREYLTVEDSVNRAFAVLPVKTRPTRIAGGLVFIYDQNIWFYDPKHGSVSEKIEKGDTLASAAKRAKQILDSVKI